MGKFDNLLFQTEKVARVPLKRVDGTIIKDSAGVEAYIDVLSTDSKKANGLRQANIDNRLNSEVKRTAAMNEEFSIAMLAELTVGWYLVKPDGEPIFDDNGTTPLPFSVEQAKELYAAPGAAPWREAVQAVSGDRVRFTGASASA